MAPIMNLVLIICVITWCISPEEMVQRKHHFAMVDEVDSVLIDDARTPLIISGPVPKGDDQQFHIHETKSTAIGEAQERIVRNYLNEAKKRIAEGDDDPKGGGLYLFRAHSGLPKYGPLIKFLSEPGIRVKMQKAENYYLQISKRKCRMWMKNYFSILMKKTIS